MIITAKELDSVDKLIIQLYSDGMTAKEIAVEMNLTYRQVDGRVRMMKKYYNAKSITHLVAIITNNRF